MSQQDSNINKVFFQKYLCQKKIGKGSFGTVYSGINTVINEKIAIKMEKKYKNNNGTLETEAYRLIYLQGDGIPKIYCYGNNQTHNILIQELLGKSLEDIFNSMRKKFSLKTVCVLGIEMIKRIKFVHSRHHIHRDIKPDNFMIGRDENENKIYIIDFGLAKKYYSTSKHQHIKFCKGKSLIGTARYCGRNAHRGFEQSRRDDIESIGYVLMYFLEGFLPWQGLKVKHGEDQFEKIAEKKYSTPFSELCKGQPEEFLQYFTHVDKLAFEEEPNYDFLIGLFQEMINKYCSSVPYDFDWKKNVCTHLSAEQEQNNKSRDVSLLVNKNGMSTMNESRNLPEKNEGEEENNGVNEFDGSLDGENKNGNKSNIIYTSASKKKKTPKKKNGTNGGVSDGEKSDVSDGCNINTHSNTFRTSKNTSRKSKRRSFGEGKPKEEPNTNAAENIKPKSSRKKRTSISADPYNNTAQNNNNNNYAYSNFNTGKKLPNENEKKKNTVELNDVTVSFSESPKRKEENNHINQNNNIQPANINNNKNIKENNDDQKKKIDNQAKNEKDPLKDSTKCVCILF